MLYCDPINKFFAVRNTILLAWTNRLVPSTLRAHYGVHGSLIRSSYVFVMLPLFFKRRFPAVVVLWRSLHHISLVAVITPSVLVRHCLAFHVFAFHSKKLQKILKYFLSIIFCSQVTFFSSGLYHLTPSLKKY